ncbi:hypothetical protein [Hymenobacter bucti]|uniref:Uncharacterized protein n=1 Tax=Hymenobacter bucti TaxID=1844114 RepID=A0ABW4QXG8_9BACT
MRHSLVFRWLAALLPVGFFALLYSPYLYFFYQYTPITPRIFQSWGYGLGSFLLLMRLVNLGAARQQDAKVLLTWALVGYNLLILLVVWLAAGTLWAFFEFFMPFRQNMISHIFLLLLLSLAGSRQILLYYGANREPVNAPPKT